jgi:elongation factor Ts
MAAISLDLIQKLRERSGAGMMDCKKALTEAEGDLEKAMDILRKKGAAVAHKRAGNTTGEGLIHAYIHPGSRVGVLLQINCETDFVARTEDMKRFAQDVCMHIAACKPLYVSSDSVDVAFIEKERAFNRAQLLEQGKPAAMVDHIVEGKIKKILAEVCLIDQPFVKNDQLTIAQLLQELVAKMGENIKISRFCRFDVAE